MTCSAELHIADDFGDIFSERIQRKFCEVNGIAIQAEVSATPSDQQIGGK